jgi:hypothetical protein
MKVEKRGEEGENKDKTNQERRIKTSLSELVTNGIESRLAPDVDDARQDVFVVQQIRQRIQLPLLRLVRLSTSCVPSRPNRSCSAVRNDSPSSRPSREGQVQVKMFEPSSPTSSRRLRSPVEPSHSSLMRRHPSNLRRVLRLRASSLASDKNPDGLAHLDSVTEVEDVLRDGVREETGLSVDASGAATGSGGIGVRGKGGGTDGTGGVGLIGEATGGSGASTGEGVVRRRVEGG